jgi:hypothetical protein
MRGIPRIGRDRPAARRIAVVSAVLALTASMAGFFVPPARAGLVNGDSVPETTFLQADRDFMPGDDGNEGRPIVTVPVTLRAGESRLLRDQLTVTGSRTAEIDHLLECLDPDTNQPAAIDGRAEEHDSGTNYSSAMGQFSMRASYLFIAPFTGTFLCQIRAVTADETGDSYSMTAVSGQHLTWLTIDNFTGDAPMWWQIPVCDSAGTAGSHCQFLGVAPILRPDHRRLDDVTLYSDSDAWTAAPDAYQAQLSAHMQITSCVPGGSSCPSWARNDQLGGASVFQTHLDFIQLDQNDGPCSVTSTPDLRYTITNNVHHFPVDYGSPITVPISDRCGGSRRFILHAVVSWIGGNPVKIDEGSQPGFRSATHAAVIVRSTAPATMVPNLFGADQSSVDLLLSRSHLITGRVTSAVSLARAGTVIAENSPAGTIEPSSSIVDVTISAGGAAVPELESLTQRQATSELAALGLATRIIQTRQCTDPGLVTGQTPIAGTLVAPGSTVTITVNRGPLHPC